MSISEQKRELESLIKSRIGKTIYVKFGKVWELGEWFYVERRFMGVLRLGTTFESAKRFCEQADLSIVTFE